MYGMNSSHGKIKRKEDFGARNQSSLEPKIPSGHEALFKFLIVFCEFDSEKHDPHNSGQTEKNFYHPILADLAGANGERHRKATTNQHRRVDGAEPDIEVVAGG